MNSLPTDELRRLFEMEKAAKEPNKTYSPIGPGSVLDIPLVAIHAREEFRLFIRKTNIAHKITLVNLARTQYVLARLDINGNPHRNPDGERINCPHIHYIRDDSGDKWCHPIDPNVFTNVNDFWQTLSEFMAYCHIIEPPRFDKGLF